MTYRKREWYEGDIIHITARGNHRNDIFRDEEDFQVYICFTKEVMKSYDGKFTLYAYCLMDNHVHLILKTENIPVGNFISRLHSIYATYFNKKYAYIGHLYQDRFFSERIMTDEQLLDTSRYIHLNPIKAKMVEKPQDYAWSSYGAYIGICEEKFTDCEKILKFFKYDKRKQLYKKFVEGKMEQAQA